MGARFTEMSFLQDPTRTVLSVDRVKFNTGLDETFFTPEELGKIGPSEAGA
jgi:hypothetical protein